VSESEETIRVTNLPIAPGSISEYDESAYHAQLLTFNVTVGGVGVFRPDTFPAEDSDPFAW